mmetsp:Transcript_2749/g.8069  ORF Transcript_2749/g.8069 Transcript_2749/m.8069 type:complete len:344 (-) Transcript_2749:503-1534(-)
MHQLRRVRPLPELAHGQAPARRQARRRARAHRDALRRRISHLQSPGRKGGEACLLAWVGCRRHRVRLAHCGRRRHLRLEVAVLAEGRDVCCADQHRCWGNGGGQMRLTPRRRSRPKRRPRQRHSGRTRFKVCSGIDLRWFPRQRRRLFSRRRLCDGERPHAQALWRRVLLQRLEAGAFQSCSKRRPGDPGSFNRSRARPFLQAKLLRSLADVRRFAEHGRRRLAHGLLLFVDSSSSPPCHARPRLLAGFTLYPGPLPPRKGAVRRRRGRALPERRGALCDAGVCVFVRLRDTRYHSLRSHRRFKVGHHGPPQARRPPLDDGFLLPALAAFDCVRRDRESAPAL